MEPERLFLVTLLLKMAVIAAVAAVLVRSVGFRRCLYLERRGLREKLIFTAFVALPLAGGVLVRLVVPNFGAGDLSLEGALLIGLMGGFTCGLLSGALLALPAVAGAQQWLALPLFMLAGWAGALCRRAAPNQEEIWAFSPFIDLELWRWLRNRLDRPFRDWQALVFIVVGGACLLEIELHRLFPRLVYNAAQPHATWEAAAAVGTSILALAIPIKIWNNARIEMKLEEQRRLLVQARLDALTSQINPHFLFNTLNSVASLVRFDPDTARVLIVKLSNILRRLLRQHESFQSLREELALIDDYLDIEVVRFGPEKLRVEKDIDPEVMEWMVPSMLVQPIVENAIRHGLAPKVEGGCVTLRARREGAEQLCLEIEDNGIGFSGSADVSAGGNGIGLANVRERLRVLYGGAAHLEIGNRAGEGTRVEIRLPYIATHAEAVAAAN